VRLLYTPSSPLSAKCLMAARHLRIAVAEVNAAVSAPPPELIGSNPLGRFPMLIRDGELPLCDSVAIMHFFDRLTEGQLYPRNPMKRAEADMLEALCDGITESLMLITYEQRFRPEEKVYQPWLDRHWIKVARGLDFLECHVPRTDKKLNGGHFALAALIAYLHVRYVGRWDVGRPQLAAWPRAFSRLINERMKTAA
jgi:glutathione S-transferase